MRTMEFESDDIRTTTTDDRGRVYLGTEYADTRLTVAIVEVHEDGPNEDELTTAYRDAAESARVLVSEWESGGADDWTTIGPAPALEDDG